MTSTEQDKELREQIHKLFGDYQADVGGYHSCYDGKWIDMTNEVCAVADFIIADRKKHELQARIHELQGVISWNVDAKTNLKVVSTITAMERVAELKQELESYGHR